MFGNKRTSLSSISKERWSAFCCTVTKSAKHSNKQQQHNLERHSRLNLSPGFPTVCTKATHWDRTRIDVFHRKMETNADIVGAYPCPHCERSYRHHSSLSRHCSDDHSTKHNPKKRKASKACGGEICGIAKMIKEQLVLTGSSDKHDEFEAFLRSCVEAETMSIEFLTHLVSFFQAALYRKKELSQRCSSVLDRALCITTADAIEGEFFRSSGTKDWIYWIAIWFVTN